MLLIVRMTQREAVVFGGGLGSAEQCGAAIKSRTQLPTSSHTHIYLPLGHGHWPGLDICKNRWLIILDLRSQNLYCQSELFLAAVVAHNTYQATIVYMKEYVVAALTLFVTMSLCNIQSKAWPKLQGGFLYLNN